MIWILIRDIIKMYSNETSTHKDFLVPSSIQRIIQKNKHSHALNTDSNNKYSYISPTKRQGTEFTFEPKINSSNKGKRSL